MQYRLIALDLDGTLIGSGQGISRRTLQAVARARERGIIIVIATGRTPHSARLYSRMIGGGPVICCNGAAVLDESGAYIHLKGIPQAPLLRALELCLEHGAMVECYTPRGIVMEKALLKAATVYAWLRRAQPAPRALLNLVRAWRVNRMIPVRSVLRWASKPNHAPVLKLMVFGETRRMQELTKRLRREVPGLQVTSSGRENVEVTAGGVSKGYGLQLLGSRLKIPREAMVAVGDSANDVEMLEYAGLGVAMGNASRAVKAVADRVTASCDQDGVALLLESLLEQ